MNSVGNLNALRSSFDAARGVAADPITSGQPLTEKEAFQSAVAGTFFKLMLQSLHKMHGKPAYFHGGQAEEMFQNQMDQQLSDEFAKSHGAPLTDALYQASVRNRITSAETSAA